MYAFDDITLGSLNNSANFVFGLTGGDLWLPEFDILNNPYVEVMGLEMTNGAIQIELKHSYELELCNEEHLDKFLPAFIRGWYAKPLCFKDRDNVRIFNNWFYEEYTSPTIAYMYCKNTTENGNWCKSED